MNHDSVREEQLAHVREEIGLLEAELRNGSMTVEGSKGQPMPNRLLAELRAHRWLLMRMLDGAQAANPEPAHTEDIVDEIRRSWENGNV